MISTNFTELNDSLMTFILSVAIGPDEVIDKLIETIDRHLEVLESLQIDSENLKLHFKCSVSIITNAYTALSYINSHSSNLFDSDPICPLDRELETIEKRFSLVFDRFKKEVPNVR